MKKLIPLLILCLFSGCATTQFSDWVDTGERFSGHQVRAETLNKTGVIPQIDDSTYTTVSATWLIENIDAYRNWAFATLPNYSGESLDCDDFATITNAVVSVQAGRAGLLAAPLIASVFVNQRESWGGVPAGGNHAVVGVYTDRGIYIIEPQSLTTNPVYAPLAEYPNHIYTIRFGR